MTICLRPKRGLRMNLRVLSVTGCSRSAMLTVCNPKAVYEVETDVELVVRSLAGEGEVRRANVT